MTPLHRPPTTDPPPLLPRHPLAWLAWLGLAFGATLTTRNPLYLLLILLTLLVVYQAAARQTQTGPAWGAFIRLGLVFGLIGVGFDTLTGHLGDTVLFRLPDAWPVIGGRITLEAVAHGLIGVVQLAGLLVAGAVFSQTLDAATLLRFVPAAFYHAGLILTIGLAFIPQTVLGFQEIRDAQRMRGHQFRAARDLLPLIGPLLTTGLERAVQLAESLETRGLGYPGDEAPPVYRPWLAQLGLLVGSLGVGVGLFGLGYWGREPWAVVMSLTGGLVHVWTVRRLVPPGRRTYYRRLRLSCFDRIVIGLSLSGLLGLSLLVALRPERMAYTPFPRLAAPPFDPWLGSAYLVLLAPVASLALPRPTAERDARDSA